MQSREGSSSIRTDLALEAREMLTPQGRKQIPGVNIENYRTDTAVVDKVTIETEEAARAMGKMPGTYVTIQVPELGRLDTAAHEEVSQLLGKELGKLLSLKRDDSVLVVGLGNWNVTPDSLGPLVTNDLLITRHIFQLAPNKLKQGLRAVSGLAPGVLGTTGIETSEIIKGVVERVKPDVVIAVDALAARSMERVCTTFQFTDTGIHPGSGVGNNRLGITRKTLGIPVFAVGVPTVVDAATIATDTLNRALKNLSMQFPEIKEIDNIMETAEPGKQQLVRGALTEQLRDFIVTPREIDTLIETVAWIIAGGINIAVHPRIDTAEMARFTH